MTEKQNNASISDVKHEEDGCEEIVDSNVKVESLSKMHLKSKENETDNITTEHDHHHHQNVPEFYDGYIQFIPFFRIIRQRQRWDEKQEHPHSDFSDTFIDLFFVGAAYNLGRILSDSLSSLGLLYFIGCFLPLYQMWTNNVYFDSRFYHSTPDVVHELYEKAGLIALASAILSIRTVDVMSNPTQYIDMFVFSISLSFAYILSILRLVEVMVSSRHCERKRSELDNSVSATPLAPEHAEKLTALYPEAYGTSLRQIGLELIPSVFFIAATIYSAIKYFSSSDTVLHRDLAGAETSDYANKADNVAISLILAGSIATNVWSWFVYLYRMPRIPNVRDHAVPLNIDHIIHRHGEWVMLVLGESILSLLIVDTPDDAWDYFFTFIFGILSIVTLQYLHFRSHPRDPDQHAMRRHVQNAVMYAFLLQLYSLCLVILGASYKMLLYEYVYAAKEAKDSSHRVLAGTSGALRFDAAERQQRVAYFFTASMATVFLCLDGIILSHQGFQRRGERCRQTRGTKILGISLALSRIALVVFVATLGLYVTKPKKVAGIGLGSIILQIIIWEIDSRVFFPTDMESTNDLVVDTTEQPHLNEH